MPQYIVKKRVQAKSMAEAIKREKHEPVEEIWLDDKPGEAKTNAIGFEL